MKLTKILVAVLLVSVGMGVAEVRAGEPKLVYPGKKWAAKRPSEVGLEEA